MKADKGNVVIEFVAIAIGLLIPIVFVATSCWDIAQAHLALRDAAVSGARSFVLSSTEAQGLGRLNIAISEVAQSYAIPARDIKRTLACSKSNCVSGGTQVTIKLKYLVRFSLPVFGDFAIPISDSHTEQVNEVR